MAMKVNGFQKLMRKIAKVPDAVKPRAQADLMLAGREINMLQRSLAPQDDGVLRGSIRTEPLPDGEVGVQILAGGEATTVTVRKSRKGNAPKYDYALGQEYGTEKMQANPFFWPGYRARKKRAMRRVRAGVKRSLKSLASKS